MTDQLMSLGSIQIIENDFLSNDLDPSVLEFNYLIATARAAHELEQKLIDVLDDNKNLDHSNKILRAKVSELETNECAYKQIIGPKSYQEVTEEIAELRKDAKQWRRWQEVQRRIEEEMPEGYSIELVMSPGDWSILFYDSDHQYVDITDFDSTNDFIASAIEYAIAAEKDQAK